MVNDSIIYTDAYGEITEAQHRLYRKFNVSPADHDMLLEVYGDGPGSRDAIMAAVRTYAKDGQYQEYLMISAAQRDGNI